MPHWLLFVSALTLGPPADALAEEDPDPSEDADGDGKKDPGASDRSQGRLQVSYLGNSYAPEVPWQSALSATGTWVSRLGVYVGLGYDFVGPYETALRSENAGVAVTPRVSRYQINTAVGYHWHRRAFGLDGELRIITEINRVVATNIALGSVPMGAKGIEGLDELSFTLGFSPRLRLYYRPIYQFSLQVAGGVDLYAINKEYFIKFTDPDTGASLGKEAYLRPRVARPLFSAGATFWF